MSILQFPERIEERPVSKGASRWAVWKSRIEMWLCRLLNRIGLPGAIQEATIDDVLTGQRVSIHVGTLFTRVSVNGRDYFFRRLSGKFDGTGTGCGG